MAKKEEKIEEPTRLESEAVVKSVPEWINCKVSVPNTHVGEILCRIPGNTPEGERRAKAILAAAEARGVALNSHGLPQFGSSPEVEYLES